MQKTYKVEKGIPIPPKKTFSKYPFAILEIGDSFLVPFKGNHSNPGLLANRVGANCRRFVGKKFCYRIIEDGVRVWRIE